MVRVTYDSRALKRLRVAAGKRREEVATQAGISRQSIYMYERGAQEPRARILARLATCLGVPISAFFVSR